MEEVIAVIFQIFFELLIQLFGSPGLNFATGNKHLDRGCGYLGLHALVGGGLGWISTLIAPQLILPGTALRVANLILAPFLAGGISWLFAVWAKSRGNNFDPTSHFWHGVAFSFMFGAARFAFGTH